MNDLRLAITHWQTIEKGKNTLTLIKYKVAKLNYSDPRKEGEKNTKKRHRKGKNCRKSNTSNIGTSE